MRRQYRQAQLFLNGEPVGHVDAEGFSDGWAFGKFKPSDGFSQFAPIFGVWAMLIHEDDDRDRASEEALDALRVAEASIDALKAELLWMDTQQRQRLRQLTIDGPLIEWSLEQMTSDV
ncbi:MAG: hypothetical protein ABSH22_10010 [Tepidisphaeraceae bacterium]|jgi:hypothetical protein